MKRKAIEEFLKYTSKETSKKGKSSIKKVPKSPQIESMKSIADDFFASADDFIKKYKRKDID
jgi:hypothetical protein|tara:strand:+ start:1408 stop:1593 length:186 start_codon:yes stop_codon:yes gene_type:complete